MVTRTPKGTLPGPVTGTGACAFTLTVRTLGSGPSLTSTRAGGFPGSGSCQVLQATGPFAPWETSVQLPTANPTEVREGATLAADAEGVSLGATRDGRTHFHVASGTYSFTLR